MAPVALARITLPSTDTVGPIGATAAWLGARGRIPAVNQPTSLRTILPNIMSLDKITESAQASVWQRLAAPIAPEQIKWRQDGKPITRDGGYVARFVCYVEAGTVRERLDAVVPGEWDLALTLLPIMESADGPERIYAFQAKLTILGISREDVGQGDDYKSAATDAFKRAAVRCGIAHELYDFEPNWVRVDSDSKFAKALENPAEAYARRYGGRGSVPPSERTRGATALAFGTPSAPLPTLAAQVANAFDEHSAPEPYPPAKDRLTEADQYPPPRVISSGSVAACPKCGGPCWDNRIGKKNPKAPDFRCKKPSCGGVIWPERKEGTLRDVKEIFDAEEEEQSRGLPF